MTTEYDLACATCGGSLDRRTVSGETLGIDVTETISVAECVECGGRYFPEQALERL